MDITVLDKTLTPIAIIDDYVSFIWTERYDEYGDFELYLPMKSEYLDIFQKDYLLTIKDSTRAMIVEELTIDSNIEDGDRLTVTGRSLESLLDRRVVYPQRTFEDVKLQEAGSGWSNTDAISVLLGNNICTIGNISPSSNRKINNFIFDLSTDERFNNLKVTAQFLGTSLYEAVKTLCQDCKVGFKVELLNNAFHMSLYMGVDRTYNQTTNNYVVFSPEFDNIISSNYVDSFKTYANVAYVGGEGEGNDRIIEQYPRDDGHGPGPEAESGFARKEVFIDSQGISSKKEDGSTMSSSDYRNLLSQYGSMQLAENYAEKKAFEGEVDATRIWKYGEDFFLGDIVQTADAYGNVGTSYISEVVISDDDNGYAIYPTFKNAEEEE